MVLSTNCWRADNGTRMGGGTWPSIMKSHPPARKELLTTSIQRALQHLLKPIHLERLLQCRPVAIGLSQLAIARRKDERRAAGNEGIGNRRDGLAVEIGVEDRKVEVGVLVASNASSMRAASAA